MTDRKHDNTGWPEGIPPDAHIKAQMADGSLCWGMAQDFDWQHDSDPVASFEVLSWGSEAKRILN